jgi:segregation and condensation protein B
MEELETPVEGANSPSPEDTRPQEQQPAEVVTEGEQPPVAAEQQASEAPAEAASQEAPAAQIGDAHATEDPATQDAATEDPPTEQPVSMEELLGPPEAVPEGPDPTADIELRAVIEAIVYVAEEPLTLAQLSAALALPQERIRPLLEQLMAEFEKPEHGITIREVAGGYKLATKAEHHEAVRAFAKSLKPPLKLSLPALETLAVIAYKQPVTAPEIMEIRGVQGAGVLKTLLDRKLIASAGRKNVIGKPILYKTTKEFLIQFGLKDLLELPSLKEFEEIRRMAFADAEPETAQSEAASPTPEAESAASEPVTVPEPTAPEPAAVEQAPAEPVSAEPAASEPVTAPEPAAEPPQAVSAETPEAPEASAPPEPPAEDQ